MAKIALVTVLLNLFTLFLLSLSLSLSLSTLTSSSTSSSVGLVVAREVPIQRRCPGEQAPGVAAPARQPRQRHLLDKVPVNAPIDLERHRVRDCGEHIDNGLGREQELPILVGHVAGEQRPLASHVAGFGSLLVTVLLVGDEPVGNGRQLLLSWSIACCHRRRRCYLLKRYKNFKEGLSRILVATDLVGRGIDIERVNIVINYDMPDSADTYLHRVGRAGRFGTKGLAITFVSSSADSDVLNQVQSRFEVDIKELPEQIDTSTYMQV
ncbi:hypothetical protein ACLB2K_059306 [Fragaria x ananassa]